MNKWVYKVIIEREHYLDMVEYFSTYEKAYSSATAALNRHRLPYWNPSAAKEYLDWHDNVTLIDYVKLKKGGHGKVDKSLVIWIQKIRLL